MPTQTVFNIKRLMGRQFEEIQLQKDIRRWPFHVANQEGKPVVRVKYQGIEKHFVRA